MLGEYLPPSCPPSLLCGSSKLISCLSFQRLFSPWILLQPVKYPLVLHEECYLKASIAILMTGFNPPGVCVNNVVLPTRRGIFRKCGSAPKMGRWSSFHLKSNYAAAHKFSEHVRPPIIFRFD